MMNSERRIEAKRISATKMVELIEPGKKNVDPFSGFTKNLSDSGIRARFDTSPEPGANILVRLYWEDGEDPVEKQGKIVWTSPDLYGDGTEVGLRLLSNIEVEQEPPQDTPTTPPAIPSVDDISCLTEGQTVRVISGGIEIETTVGGIGEITDDGEIKITLRLSEKAPAISPESDDAQMLIDAEDWKPHPFKEAWSKARVFVVPTAKFVHLVSLVIIGLMASGSKWLWNQMPTKITTPAAQQVAKLKITQKVHKVRNTMSRISIQVTARIATFKTSKALNSISG